MKLKDEGVFLKLSTMATTLDSDRYFTEEFRQLTEKVLKEPVLNKNPAVTVPIHSTRSGLPPPRNW